jgi:hypothetical protein
MSAHTRVRRGALIAVTFASLLTAARPSMGQAPKFVARFAATTAGLNPGAGVAITIDVLRWSTDEEADRLVAAFKEKGAKQWADALQAVPSVGYVWAATSSLGYSVKLARRVATPDGGARLVLAIERPLGSWDHPVWKAVGPLAADYPFTIIELRVNRSGIGEGKASLAAKLVIDDTAKAPALEDYALAPVLLKTVRRTDASAAPQ